MYEMYSDVPLFQILDMKFCNFYVQYSKGSLNRNDRVNMVIVCALTGHSNIVNSSTF